LFFIYTGKELPDCKLVQNKMQFLMHKLVDQFALKEAANDTPSITPNPGT
jgi:hypothetical protein